ncbi:MAG: phosphoribosylglycinamide formyltransferase [Flavobacteriaceae bacterium]
MKIKIAIFASGNGSNAENLIHYFKKSDFAEVALILTNNKNAGVIDRAARLNVPVFEFSKEDLHPGNTVLEKLAATGIDWIILAGFLLKFPENILKQFPNKVINIHPALLPKYGGKGMYGLHVHNAVIENKEKETGITIHFVNEKYDEGKIIFQAKTDVSNSDTPESVAEKIHKLEQEHFPKVVEKLILSS